MQTDAFSGFFHVLICGIVLVACLIALDSFPEQAENVGEFFALVLFGTVGMVLMSSAVELLLVFIALEISSISTYILAGFRKHTAKGPEASLKYFLLGSFATAFFLYGVALVFGATGTTNIHEIAAGLSQTETPGFAVIALAMMLIGIGFKVSAAPFQVWTPDVYEGAPSPVVALMSTAPKAAAFAVLVRIAYGIFPLLHVQWSMLLWLMAALSMTVGNLGALRQQNVKRMLAYSSIAHAGYLLVAFAALSNEAIAAASFYAVAYAAMNVGVFADCEPRGWVRRTREFNWRLSRAGVQVTPIGSSAGVLPDFSDRDSLHRWLLRKVLCVHGGHPRWRDLAGNHRSAEQRDCGVLLPAPADNGLRAALRGIGKAGGGSGEFCACHRAGADRRRNADAWDTAWTRARLGSCGCTNLCG